jgi:hypothetical protein
MGQLGWLGDAFLVFGMYELGNKRRNGFLASIIGEFLWILAASSRHQWDLVAICVIFAVMAAKGFYTWGN